MCVSGVLEGLGVLGLSVPVLVWQALTSTSGKSKVAGLALALGLVVGCQGLSVPVCLPRLNPKGSEGQAVLGGCLA